MGKLCTAVSKKGTQLFPQVLDDFQLKLRKEKERQQGEDTTFSYINAVHPRSPLQARRTAAAANGFVDKWICQKPEIWTRHFALEETAANMKENSGSPRNFPQVLADVESRTSRAVNSMQIDNCNPRQAKNEATTAEKWKKLIPVIMVPCPPSTPKNNDCDTMSAFRRRKFRGNCPGSPFNEGHGKRVENRPLETISVDNFTFNLSENELRWSKADSDEEESDNNQVEEKEEERDSLDAHVSDCLLQVNNGVTSNREKMLNRAQGKNCMDLVSKVSRQDATITAINYSQLHKEKRRLSPSPLDTFAQRQLGCNEKVCRENLKLDESSSPRSCKDFDSAKEMMINNWLIDVSIVNNISH